MEEAPNVIFGDAGGVVLTCKDLDHIKSWKNIIIDFYLNAITLASLALSLHPWCAFFVR